jgi:CPA2 family monovalent cation:H+ antiporter-2
MIGGELTGIALVASAALICGAVFSRLRQPPLVGYILAGILLGPTAMGVVEDREQIALLAELGVLVLLFIIGLELSLRAFKLVWRQSLGTMALQVVGAMAIAFLVKFSLGWGAEQALLVGFVLALSSTAVAIKILEDIGELRSEIGRIAIGVLIAQDLAVVPMMLIIGTLGDTRVSLAGSVFAIVAAVGILSAVILVLGQRRKYRLPFIDTIEGDVDLTTMAALGICFAAAAGSGLLGLSPAYGAFLAGLVVGNTADRAKMIHATQPIQAVLIMVFFVSIGLLIDIGFIWANLWLVLVLVLAVTVVKTAMNIAIIRFLGASWKNAFLAGTVMGQIGEFSFVLAAAGLSVGLIGDEDNRLLVSLIALSLAVSPLWLITARRLEAIRWRDHMRPQVVLQRLYGRELKSLERVARPGMGIFRGAAGRLAQGLASLSNRASSPFQRGRGRSRTAPHRSTEEETVGSGKRNATRTE